MQATGSAGGRKSKITFPTADGPLLEVYTTRPDTLYGATYMVFSPEHPLMDEITEKKKKKKKKKKKNENHRARR